MVAPAPDVSMSLSYIPRKESKAPATVNKEVTCPGVNLVLSKMIWAMRQAKPDTRKAYTKIMNSPPMKGHVQWMGLSLFD